MTEIAPSNKVYFSSFGNFLKWPKKYSIYWKKAIASKIDPFRFTIQRNRTQAHKTEMMCHREKKSPLVFGISSSKRMFDLWCALLDLFNTQQFIRYENNSRTLVTFFFHHLLSRQSNVLFPHVEWMTNWVNWMCTKVFFSLSLVFKYTHIHSIKCQLFSGGRVKLRA